MQLKEKLTFGMSAMRRLQSEFFPSQHQSMIKQWRQDGGDTHLRFAYDLNVDSVVLDFGGFEGQWSSDLFSRYLCRIFIFEPVKAHAEQIRKRFTRNANITVLQYGLGATTRHDIIHLGADGSSLFHRSGPTEDIEILDAREWFASQPFSQIDLVKINIEGGEYELLDRMIGIGLVEKIRDIQVQFHPIGPTSRADVERIRAELARTHRPTYQYDFVWENWQRKDS